jgi:hypothetical protein
VKTIYRRIQKLEVQVQPMVQMGTRRLLAEQLEAMRQSHTAARDA